MMYTLKEVNLMQFETAKSGRALYFLKKLFFFNNKKNLPAPN